MGSIFLKSLLFLLIASSLAAAWTSDLDAAQKTAEKEKKALYLVFVSTDSSGACQQLERRILSSEKFQSLAGEKYVLVKVDLPLKQRLQKENHQRMLDLAKRFGVGGAFPTSFYLDASGRPFHQENGVLPGGPEKYAGHLLGILQKREKRDEDLKAASKMLGLKKARALVDLLKPLPDEVVLNFYAEQMDELAELDPEDTLKFRNEKVTGKAYADFEDAVKKVFHKDSYDQVVTLVDEFIGKHAPEGDLKQKVLFRKLAALNHGGNLEPAIKVADEIIFIDKESSHGRFSAQIREKIKKRLGR
jgi:thioredoxin-related protein